MLVLWKAVRAVAMETLGVMMVVVLLIGGAGWTAESAGVHTGHELDRARQWLRQATREVTASITPALDQPQRERYVEQRLEHYSRMYRDAAREYLKRALQEEPSRTAVAQPELVAPSSQLLGAL